MKELRTREEIHEELIKKGFTPNEITFNEDLNKPYKCMMCGVEINTVQPFRSLVPKELMDADLNGINQEKRGCICRQCEVFRKEFDFGFLELCRALKFYEQYRTTSKREFFQSQLVFNVDREVLLDLYFNLLSVCYEAWLESNDESWRSWMMEELNYYWRKKDA